MKLNKKTKALLVLAGMTFMASAANAAVTNNGNTPNTDFTGSPTPNGDLILTVAGNQTGSGTPVDLEFDLGLASTAFTTNGAVLNLSSTVLASDLNSVFGSTWYTSGALTWSVVGSTVAKTAGNPKFDTVYATSAASSPGTSGAVQDQSIANLGSSNGPTNAIKAIYGQLSTTTALGDNASAAMVAQSVGSSYSAEEGSTTDSFSLGQSVDGQLGGSSGAQVLDLYELIGGASSSTLLGTFTFASSGPSNAVVTFTAVPEPSTYAMLGLGAFGMYYLARRKRQFNFTS